MGPKKGNNYNSKHGYWAKCTLTFTEVDPSKVKVLVVPGKFLFFPFGEIWIENYDLGGFCTDRLRRYPECLELTRKSCEVRDELLIYLVQNLECLVELT